MPDAKRAAASGAAGAHALYRTVRAFFGKIRFCYDDVDRPGIVPENANPLVNLQLPLPETRLLVWPRSAVEAFVGLADERGHPSIGDAIVMMSWPGVRRLDWLGWSATVFDRDLLAFRQKKTAIRSCGHGRSCLRWPTGLQRLSGGDRQWTSPL